MCIVGLWYGTLILSILLATLIVTFEVLFLSHGSLLFFSSASGYQGTIYLFLTIYFNSRSCFNTRWFSHLWIWFWSSYFRYTINILSWSPINTREKGICGNIFFVYTHQFFAKWDLWNHSSTIFDSYIDRKIRFWNSDR